MADRSSAIDGSRRAACPPRPRASRAVAGPRPIGIPLTGRSEAHQPNGWWASLRPAPFYAWISRVEERIRTDPGFAAGRVHRYFGRVAFPDRAGPAGRG